MSRAGQVLERSYRVGSVALGIYAEDPAVLEAMELRLRDFSSEPLSELDLRIEFDSSQACGPPAGESRPVYDTPHGSLYYLPRADAVCGQLGGVSLRCEAGRGVAVLRADAFLGRDLYLATHPLATIALMELLERRRLFSLHAACLAGDGGRGVLLAGSSGAGKSTLALALARAGMGFLSDDLVFLSRQAESAGVEVLGFADSVGLPEYAAEHFSELRERLGEPPADGFPKRLGRIEELLAAPAVRACQPQALIFPEVAPNQPSRLAPLDPGEALLRLVPDVLLTEEAATRAHLGAIAALLGQVRCYTLRSGRDLERAAELVRGLV